MTKKLPLTPKAEGVGSGLDSPQIPARAGLPRPAFLEVRPFGAALRKAAHKVHTLFASSHPKS